MKPVKYLVLVTAGSFLLVLPHSLIAEEGLPLTEKEIAALPCPPDPALGAELAASRFLVAFTRLDEICFDQMWTADATAFLPKVIGEFGPGRLNGREEILAAFNRFFAGRRASGQGLLRIDPQSLRVDQQGNVAVVTFVLGPKQDSRRTFVFRREVDGWRIWHHHASRLRANDANVEADARKHDSEGSDAGRNSTERE